MAPALSVTAFVFSREVTRYEPDSVAVRRPIFAVLRQLNAYKCANGVAFCKVSALRHGSGHQRQRPVFRLRKGSAMRAARRPRSVVQPTPSHHNCAQAGVKYPLEVVL